MVKISIIWFLHSSQIFTLIPFSKFSSLFRKLFLGQLSSKCVKCQNFQYKTESTKRLLVHRSRPVKLYFQYEIGHISHFKKKQTLSNFSRYIIYTMCVKSPCLALAPPTIVVAISFLLAICSAPVKCDSVRLTPHFTTY